MERSKISLVNSTGKAFSTKACIWQSYPPSSPRGSSGLLMPLLSLLVLDELAAIEAVRFMRLGNSMEDAGEFELLLLPEEWLE